MNTKYDDLEDRFSLLSDNSDDSDDEEQECLLVPWCNNPVCKCVKDNICRLIESVYIICVYAVLLFFIASIITMGISTFVVLLCLNDGGCSDNSVDNLAFVYNLASYISNICGAIMVIHSVYALMHIIRAYLFYRYHPEFPSSRKNVEKTIYHFILGGSTHSLLTKGFKKKAKCTNKPRL